MLLAIAVFGAALSVWEVLNFEELTGISYSSLYIGSAILAIPFFLLTYRVSEGRLRCRPLEFMGRSLLPWMYTFYMAVMFFIKFVIFDNIDAPLEILDGIGIIVSVILDVLLAYLTYRLILFLIERAIRRRAH